MELNNQSNTYKGGFYGKECQETDPLNAIVTSGCSHLPWSKLDNQTRAVTWLHRSGLMLSREEFEKSFNRELGCIEILDQRQVVVSFRGR